MCWERDPCSAPWRNPGVPGAQLGLGDTVRMGSNVLGVTRMSSMRHTGSVADGAEPRSRVSGQFFFLEATG